MIKWFLLAVVAYCMFMIIYYYFKFRNPYSLTVLIGRKGSGKSTLLTKFAIQHQKKGWKVYSNFPVPGAFKYDPEQIGQLMFPRNSLVLIDEIGLVFNNRSFKSFPTKAVEWFKLQRHYGVKVVAASQADDYDKVVRLLVDHLYIIHNVANCISYARKVNRTVSIVSAKDGAGESRIVEDLSFTSIFSIPFGGAIITWIPKYTKYFNSFSAPLLPINEFVLYDYGKDLYHVKSPALLFFNRRGNSERPVSGRPDPEGRKGLKSKKTIKAGYEPYVSRTGKQPAPGLPGVPGDRERTGTE